MRKKGISLILSVLLILVMLPPASVLADTEFEIASYADLCTFRDRVNAGELELKAKLTEDIVCENADGTPAVDWTPIGEAFYPYEGTFDGQGHTITGLSNSGVDYSGSTAGVFYVGLFGFINGCGTVKNVVIEDCDLSFSPGAQGMHIYIGAVAAENHGTIENCRNTGTVTATLDDAYVGGIVGFSDGTLKNCNNTGAVSGSGVNVEIGGVAGSSYRPVENCYNLGTVSCIGNDSKIGGVVGYCYKQATGCYNSGEVSGSGENNYIGGVVGCNFDTIENCYNSGEVSGSGEDAYTGGVIGCGFGTAGYCYNSGEVFGSGEDASTGGVVGYSFYPVDNCYNTGEVSGSGEDACIGGVFGNASGDVNCCYNTGKVSGSGEYACIGGVAGCNSDPIGNCYNSGEVSGSSESTYVGGIVGSSHYPVNNCYNAGAVSVEAWSHVGGIVGGASKVVSRCLNVGPVSGGESSDVGGIAGVVNSLGSLENCLNAGAVSGYNCSFTGGIVGYNIYGKVQKCLNVGAIASNNYNDAGGVVGTMPNHQTETSYVEYCYCSNTIAPVGSVGSGTVTSVKALTADELKTLANCVGFEAENWAEGPEFPLLKGFVYLFYDANGGEGSMMMTPGLFGWGLTAAENTFSNASYLAFAGWNTKADGKGDNVDAGSSVTLAANELYRTLYAQWKKLTYTIKFVNDDGTVLQSGLIEYGETPAYTGETPTKASTAQYTYTFAGWTPEIAAVTGDATYTATYSKTVNKYTVKFVNEDGTVLQSSEVEYGETPAYTGETPTKAATAQYTYTFAGWTPEITAVTGDATYTAAFESNIRSYNVTFTVNGETYAERTFEVGAAVIAPEYTVPEGYTFSGWQVPEAMPAEDVTLDATLTINTYTVSFVDGITGEVIAEVTVEHGADAEAPEAPAHICYLFTGWEGEYTGVKCDVTVTACYKLLGDIDGDGVTTAADALMIMRYSIEVIDEIDTSMADVNGDGKVDLVDALIVLRHAMGLV